VYIYLGAVNPNPFSKEERAMQDKHEQLGEHGAIPGVPNGPPPAVPPEPAQPNAAMPYEIHEVARLFPPMSEKEFAAFKANVKANNGLTDPIVLYQGKVIDGRHRMRACVELGLPIPTREWDGKGSLLAFVVSQNLARRHLKEPQRAMVAALLAVAAQAVSEHHLTEVQPLQDKDLSDGASLRPTHAMAAKLCCVSERSVDSAVRIIRLGAPELLATVQAGKMTIATASDLAELPHDQQVKLLAKSRGEINDVVRGIREERERKKRAEEGKIPLRPIPSDLEILDSFLIGDAKLTKTQRRFCLELSEDWWSEIEDAAHDWPYFELIIERGLLVKKKKEKPA
jgi:hypothetical protein